MDDRHHQRVLANLNSNTSNISNVLYNHITTRRFLSILKPIRTLLSNSKIPFATISTTFLFSSFAQAEGLPKGIIPSVIEGGGNPKSGFGSEAIKFFADINTAILWIKQLPSHINEWSLDLLSFTYETLVNLVLYTPIFLFDNPLVKNTSLTFSVISISITILCTIYEMIMKMCRKKHTDFKQILKRFPLVVAGSGLAPFLFQQAFQYINKLTKGINQIGGVSLSGDSFANIVTDGVDTLILLVFDVTLLGLLIPLFLRQGQRWWNLFLLSAVSPLALTSWIFDRHSHMFNQWWNTVKRLSVVQLVYATFILLIGVFIYGTRFISSEYWLIKGLVVLGGLFSLSNPPQIVKSYERGDGDVFDIYNGYKNTAKNVYDTITLRNLKPVKYLKGKNAERSKQIASLRKKHGRRFINDLL